MQSSETPNPTIDPRLPKPLAAFLEKYEVPAEEGALIWEIEKYGFSLVLEGPRDLYPNPEYRWRVGVLIRSADIGRKNFDGRTARIALARAYRWIVTTGSHASINVEN